MILDYKINRFDVTDVNEENLEFLVNDEEIGKIENRIQKLQTEISVLESDKTNYDLKISELKSKLNDMMVSYEVSQTEIMKSNIDLLIKSIDELVNTNKNGKIDFHINLKSLAIQQLNEKKNELIKSYKISKLQSLKGDSFKLYSEIDKLAFKLQMKLRELYRIGLLPNSNKILNQIPKCVIDVRDICMQQYDNVNQIFDYATKRLESNENYYGRETEK